MKDALTTAATATEKATEKAEGVTAGKIEGVQSEMRIRLSALEAKVDANATQESHNKGRGDGMAGAWGILTVVIAVIVSIAGVLVSVLRH